MLIFHSLAVHAASPNVSGQMRLPLDSRFQDAKRVLNRSNLVFAGESGKSRDKTYANWRSDEPKFYREEHAPDIHPGKNLSSWPRPRNLHQRVERMPG